MKSVTLLERHISMLTDKNFQHEFTAGITSILRGEEPQASCSHMKTVFFNLVHGPMTIPGIPKFDPTGMEKNELARYSQIQAGKVPSAGLDHSYKDLKFRAITTLPKEYSEKLYSECQDRLNNKQGTAEYRKFIGYLAEVMKHCADSGEL